MACSQDVMDNKQELWKLSLCQHEQSMFKSQTTKEAKRSKKCRVCDKIWDCKEENIS